tara:strand:+ start:226 stop:471 length:246 start_codon:yes stop_codon:yes gene_type:complete
MLTKDQAIYNLSKAYLERLIANRLFWDNTACLEADREYYEKTTKFETMRKAYIECDIMTYTESQEVTEGKYKLSKVEVSAE